MADAARLLLRAEKVDDAVVLVEIAVNVAVAHAVEKVKVEVIDLTALELSGEDLLGLGKILCEIAGELAGKIVRFARVFTQNAAHHRLRLAVVIGPGGVVIVHAVFHCATHDLAGPFLVDPAVVAVQNGETHAPEPQRGKLDILKLLV